MGIRLPPRKPGDLTDTVFTTQRSEAGAPARKDGEGFVQPLSNPASDTPMVQRVARAICKAGVEHQRPGDAPCQEICGLCEAEARGAIGSMLEPTPRMVTVGEGHLFDPYPNEVALAYRGMVLEALNDDAELQVGRGQDGLE